MDVIDTYIKKNLDKLKIKIYKENIRKNIKICISGERKLIIQSEWIAIYIAFHIGHFSQQNMDSSIMNMVLNGILHVIII